MRVSLEWLRVTKRGQRHAMAVWLRKHFRDYEVRETKSSKQKIVSFTMVSRENMIGYRRFRL